MGSHLWAVMNGFHTTNNQYDRSEQRFDLRRDDKMRLKPPELLLSLGKSEKGKQQRLQDDARSSDFEDEIIWANNPNQNYATFFLRKNRNVNEIEDSTLEEVLENPRSNLDSEVEGKESKKRNNFSASDGYEGPMLVAGESSVSTATSFHRQEVLNNSGIEISKEAISSMKNEKPTNLMMKATPNDASNKPNLTSDHPSIPSVIYAGGMPKVIVRRAQSEESEIGGASSIYNRMYTRKMIVILLSVLIFLVITCSAAILYILLTRTVEKNRSYNMNDVSSIDDLHTKPSKIETLNPSLQPTIRLSSIPSQNLPTIANNGTIFIPALTPSSLETSETLSNLPNFSKSPSFERSDNPTVYLNSPLSIHIVRPTASPTSAPTNMPSFGTTVPTIKQSSSATVKPTLIAARSELPSILPKLSVSPTVAQSNTPTVYLIPPLTIEPTFNLFASQTIRPTASPTSAAFFTTSPTVKQSTSSTINPALTDLISGFPKSQAELLSDENSPQFKSLIWLSRDPNLDNYTQLKKIQRYAMATFFHSTSGPKWKQSANWLSYSNECKWYSSAPNPCNDEGILLTLDLRENNLQGTIPAEISLLSNLRRLFLRWNSISGRIPSQISRLSNLLFLQLTRNYLTGNLPTELVNMSNLLVMGVGRNKLNGTIPALFGSFKQLNTWGLERNNFTGTIPSSIGLLTNLVRLALDHNNFTGTIPKEMGNLSFLLRFNLNGNNIDGEIPQEFCNRETLPSIRADCLEIECECCAECCIDENSCSFK